ncbi:hypothetical protein ACFRAM_20320 [Paenibacillus sp. NPDC056722]|uniref:hypothetical protein n=1 Tax=Paenibacillus sp. NPDC056722 TaxID=3345924 RepID=UPI0036A48E8D
MKKRPKATRKRADHLETLILLICPTLRVGTDYYGDGFSLKDHRDLARLLANNKSKAMVLHSSENALD